MAAWKSKEAAIRKLERDGSVDPNDLIEAAREEDHPCHGDFTWDIDRAAQKCWRDEARALIRKCCFEVLVDEVKHSVCQYVASQDEETTFVSLPKVRGQKKARKALAADVANALGAVSRCYGIAVAKNGSVGQPIIDKLKKAKDILLEVKADIDG